MQYGNIDGCIHRCNILHFSLPSLSLPLSLSVSFSLRLSLSLSLPLPLFLSLSLSLSLSIFLSLSPSLQLIGWQIQAYLSGSVSRRKGWVRAYSCVWCALSSSSFCQGVCVCVCVCVCVIIDMFVSVLLIIECRELSYYACLWILVIGCVCLGRERERETDR